MSIHGPHHPYHNPEPHRVSEAKRLSKLLWEARELCDMYGDIVNLTPKVTLWKMDGPNYPHRVRDEIDAYRAEKGWSPNGFGGEMDSDLQADLVEATARYNDLVRMSADNEARAVVIETLYAVQNKLAKVRESAAAVINAWDESTSFQPCEECMKSGVALWPYQSEEAVNDAIEVLRNLIGGETDATQTTSGESGGHGEHT
jgi:hypothetical protein